MIQHDLLLQTHNQELKTGMDFIGSGLKMGMEIVYFGLK